MKKVIIFLLVACSIPIGAYSQKYQLGKVTEEELTQKSHPGDSSAVAAILFNKCSVVVDDIVFPSVTYIFEMKIKIYKKEGFEFGNFEKKYYGLSSLSFFDVATYNWTDGTIEKSKVGDEGIFSSKDGDLDYTKKIIFPNVKEGSIIEYKFVYRSFQIYKLHDFYFQHDIPVNFVQFSVTTPSEFVYNKGLYGFLELDAPTQQITSENKITASYAFEDLPAMKDEMYVNNINNYRGRMTYELASVRKRDGSYMKFGVDWEAIVKKIYKSEHFEEQLKIDGYFKSDLKPLLEGLTSEEEKIKTIFNFVKSRMTWNGYSGTICDLGVKKAYKTKTGNTGDINLMLVAMLRYAELDAYPIIISTRDNGISVSPSLSAFNHVIAGVQTSDQMILLDAIDKNAYVNIIPIRDLNWIGRIMKGEESSAQINLVPTVISKDIINVIGTINSEGRIEGKIKEQHFDYDAYYYRDQATDLTNEKKMEHIEKSYKGIEIEEYDVINMKEFDKPVVESYSFSHNNCIEIIGDKMYFSPLLFFAITENPFKQEVREYPVDFGYPNQDKYLIVINIPNGYAIEKMPASVSIPMTDGKGSLKYLVSNNDKQIQLSVTLEINKAIIEAESYQELKTFFSEVVKKQTEKIVLKKV